MEACVVERPVPQNRHGHTFQLSLGRVESGHSILLALSEVGELFFFFGRGRYLKEMGGFGMARKRGVSGFVLKTQSS